MLAAIESLPVSEVQAPIGKEPEKLLEKNVPETVNPDDWFTVDQFSDGWDTDYVTAPTMFHRKIYTFSDDKAYINTSKVNKLIKNLDDLVLFLTRCCCYRISEDRYITVVGKRDTNEVAVVGEFSPRFVANNNLKEHDLKIQNISKYRVVSLKQFEHKLEGGLETHLEAAKGRLNTSWDAYRADIDALFK